MRAFRGARPVQRRLIVPLLLATLAVSRGHAEPLAVFVHNIVGARLMVSPAALYVPKNIPGSLAVTIASSDGGPHPKSASLGIGRHVEAVLRGPAFPAYRLLGLPGEPLILPPIPLPGEYEIDDVRLINTETGEPVLEASPSRIPVHVFADVLVSQVTSRPLSVEEIRARGVTIDASNFSAVEFEASFVIEGRPFPVRFPVVTPKFKQSVEIIPRIEMEARLALAKRVNQEVIAGLDLPPALKLPGLGLQLAAVHLSQAADSEVTSPPPVIPALVVIPGSIGFLNRFFSVQVFVANGAPPGSPLTVHDVQAEIVLPTGRDLLADTEDDPLALARIDGVPRPVVDVRGLGPDGAVGTTDDVGRLQPAATGQAELLVEGRKEGLHTFDIKLRAVLDGLVAGELPLEGLASGAVLVRNPKFSIVFAHPATVRAGEPYEASITVLNTSETPAELVSIHLNQASISGAHLAATQPETVTLGTLAPGQSQIGTFSLVADRTGGVALTNLTGDDGLSGRFDLRMGVDERGVPLSAQVIQYPDEVSLLPENVRRAADRVLGQALSVATAAVVPAGVRRIEVDTVRKRVIELAEAGQRLQLHDSLERVLTDLLLDWHGGRVDSLGFDQILREAEAGAQFSGAVFEAIPPGATAPSRGWVSARAADLAGRDERWGWMASGAASIAPVLRLEDVETGGATQAITDSASFVGPDGAVVLIRDPRARQGVLEVVVPIPAAASGTTVEWFEQDATGVTHRHSFAVASNPSMARCYHYFPLQTPDIVTIDDGCAQLSSGQAAVTSSEVQEQAPEILSVQQSLGPIVGRPYLPCGGPQFAEFGRVRHYGNYGTLFAVLFSKPMSSAIVERPENFTLNSGAVTNGIKLQPGGRVALVNMRDGVATWRPRDLLVSNQVQDARGHSVAAQSHAIELAADQGVSIAGRLIGTTGEPVPGVPVTLTMNDQVATPTGCFMANIRASQTITDNEGRFTFDYVMAGSTGYTLGATDIRGLSSDALNVILQASPAGDLDPAEIEAMAKSPATAQQVMRAFSASTLAGGIALADAVDRVTFRDSIPVIPVASPRLRSEVPVVLRFRGRGLVEGTVLASDGVTPVTGAAVNLYPERNSRELGRGVFSDAAGHFAFTGVPLGAFSVEAKTGDGLARTVSGRLEEPGETVNVPIVLSEAEVLRGSLVGTVYESDGVTPHPRASVQVSTTDLRVLAVGVADEAGHYSFASLQARAVRVEALSFDGRRAGVRNTTVLANGETIAHVVLAGTSVVVGRVEFANGTPAAGALVEGGESIVTTDALGQFTITGVPVGVRTLRAGMDIDPSRGLNFVRIAATRLEVLPGVINAAVIRFSQQGEIRGRVYDELGHAVGSVRVAMPQPGGFQWVRADANGNYVFSPVAIGDHFISAPSPPVVEPPSEDELRDLAASGSDQLEAVLGSVLASRLSGPPAANPDQVFGVARTSLTTDGQIAVADIHYYRQGTVTGVVVNHLGVPIGAEVHLLGQKLSPNAGPMFGERGVVRSDPATGTFSFSHLPVGPYTVTAHSPFYARDPSLSGATTLASPNATGVQLQFAPAESQGARLTGRVLRDGNPVGAGVHVAINFTADYEILTAADGIFDTQIDLPARTYRVDVLDSTTGRRGQGTVRVQPGIVAYVEVSLVSMTGGLDITVRQGDGSAAGGASVVVDRTAVPANHWTLTANAQGVVSLSSLAEGSYSVRACLLVAQTQQCRSQVATVGEGVRTALELRLGGAGTIAGTYVEADGHTPVGFAQLSIGNVAIVSTDGSGAFEAPGIPLGTYAIVGHNPITGRSALASARIATPNQVVRIALREDALGEVVGRVLGSDGTSVVAGAIVTLSPSSTLFPATTVTTDPGGNFRFAGVPPGRFTLSARHPSTVGLNGNAGGEMPLAATTLTVDVPLSPRGALQVTVREANGTGVPASLTVHAGQLTFTLDTDNAGAATLSSVPLGAVTVRASSRVSGRTRSRGVTTLTLSTPGESVATTVSLRGVGAVTGHLLTSSGVPSAGSDVVLEMQASGSTSITDTEHAITASDGAFSFPNVPIGQVRARGTSVALAASQSGELTVDGAVLDFTLHLSPSADVYGYVVRADGTTPVPNLDISVAYTPPSGLAGSIQSRTSSVGRFAFSALPVGPYTITARDVAHDGLLHHEDTIVASAQPINLGNLRLDEAPPTVTEVLPVDGATGVSVTSHVEITFSEPMDPVFGNAAAAYLADDLGARVPLGISWSTVAGETRQLVLTPNAALRSETNYTVVVLGPAVLGLAAQMVGPGPTDMARRPMVVALVSRFTTVDSVPPVIESFTPEQFAEQLDPSSVVRIGLNEPVAPASVQLELRNSANEIVPASVTIGLNSRVVVLTPTGPLNTNDAYEARLLALTDVAGNSLAGLPVIHSFFTMDTMGPTVVDLVPAPGSALVEQALIDFDVTLGAIESGVQIQATSDLVHYSLSSLNSMRVRVNLGAQGQTIVRARGIDHFGNYGPWFSKTFSVAPNFPPEISVVQLAPASGPLRSGETYTIRVEASDDSGISSLSFLASGVVVAQQQSNALSSLTLTGVLPASIGPGSVIAIDAEAQDTSGIIQVAPQVVFPIADGAPPAVVATASGQPILPGSTLVVTLTADDAFGLAAESIAVSGAATYSESPTLIGAPTHDSRSFSISIPSNATSSSPIHVVVSGTDTSGYTGNHTLELMVADTVAPTIVAVSPPDLSTNISISALPTVTFSEPVEGVSTSTFYLALGGNWVPSTVVLGSGATSATIHPIGPLQPNATYEIIVAAGITDLAGNALAPMRTVFQTQFLDVVGPHLVGIRPADTSTGASLAMNIEFQFDEPVASGVVAADVVVTDLVSNAVLPGTLTFPDGRRTIRYSVRSNLLAPGRQYRAALGGLPRDAAGNLATSPSMQPWSTVTTTFTTATIGIEVLVGTYPAAGRLVEGHLARARIVPSANAQPSSATWFVDGTDAQTTFGHPPEAMISPHELLGTAPETTTLVAEASVPSVGRFSLPSVVLTIEPGSGDFDGDGLSNDVEASAGTNPWVYDRNSDPDLDQLTNAEEIALGTDPLRADTDGDGSPDNADMFPLVGGRPPGVYLSSPAETRSALVVLAGRTFMPPSLTLAAPITLEMWVSPTAPCNVWGSLQSPAALNVAFDGTRFGVSARSIRAVQWAASNSTMSAWHHVAVTYDGVHLRLVVDGRQEVDSETTGALDTSGGGFGVGSDFLGHLDEVRVWSYARSPSDVALSMHRSYSGAVAGLLAAYSFESGAITADSTGHGYTATAANPGVTSSGAQVYAERAVAMTAATQALSFAAVDLDGAATSLRLRTLPTHGRLRTSAGVYIVAPGPFTTQLTYVPDPGYVGSDGFEVVADDGVLTSLPMTVEVATQTGNAWIGVSTLHPDDWSEPSNWSLGHVPQSTEIATIPEGVVTPVRLRTSATIDGLYVAPGSELHVENNGATETQLTVSGSAIADGLVDGDGFVRLTGAQSTIRGSFPASRVAGTVLVGGPTTVDGSLLVQSGSLTVGGNRVTIAGSLTAPTGGLVMTSSADFVEVEGEIRLVSGAQANLTAGVLRGHANFIVESPNFFAPSGGHVVELVGPSTSIRLDYAGVGRNHFHHLTITSPSVALTAQNFVTPPLYLSVTGNLTLGDGVSPTVVTGPGDVSVGGDLTVASGATLDAPNITVGGVVNVAGAGAVSSPGVGTYTRIGNILGTLSAGTLTLTGGSGAFDWTPDDTHVTFTNLAVARQVTLAGDLSVPGDVSIRNAGVLYVNGHTVSIGGGLTTTSVGLRMQNPSDLVDVQGDILWTGNSGNSTWLSAGVLRGHADFSSQGANMIHASGTHRVELLGPAAAVDIGFPSTNYFQHLQVQGAAISQGSMPTVLGTLVLGASASLSAPALEVRGSVTVGTGASLVVTALNVGAFVEPSAGFVQVASLQISGLGSAQSDWSPSAAHYSISDLTITGRVRLLTNLIVNGSMQVSDLLTLNGHNLTVGGSLTANSGQLVMTNPSDAVEVQGDIVWATFAVTSLGSLTAGTITVHGDFRVEGASALLFQASGTHQVDLVSSSAAIRMDVAGPTQNRFQNLRVLAPGVTTESRVPPNSAWGLYAAGNITIGSGSPASLTSAVPVGSSGVLSVAGNAQLTAPTVECASLGVQAGLLSTTTLDFFSTATALVDLPQPDPAHVAFTNLTVQRPLRLTSGFVVPGNLTLNGTNGALTINARTLSVGGALAMGGRLHMTQAADLVAVAGPIAWTGASSNLTNGTLRGSSNFTVSTSGAFAPSGSHRVELVGATTQIRTDYPATTGNRFHNLTISSPSAVFLTPISPNPQQTARVNGALVVSGSSGAPAAVTVAAGQTLNVVGQITVGPDATLTNNGTMTGTCHRTGSGVTVTGYTCP